ncbi:hypothetical protein QF038_002677 [Pseudarthrobacter sp. W1I19]|uniref:ScyD/ScyE family protein n=1 Tax=Pseudarthrobacter sp. W1I19 TaxID=3042288 RepID=UPI002780297C|nr:ScyD/ScyE family protein [Pseudarthrobacter sp. W1I19]MDQ0924169.1 hypothetical protein [Pseudarthrobacter sp. W1I19]
MKIKFPVAACIAAAALVLPAGPAAAGSSDEPTPRTRAEGLAAPLSLAVDAEESILVTQNFAGLLSRVNDDRTTTTLYQAKEGWDVGGVEMRHGTTYFVESVGAGVGIPENLQGNLKSIDDDGDVRTIADLANYERKHNPDGDQHYGFGDDVSDECLKDWPEFPPARYEGTVDSHPYGVAIRSGKAYVADAGANAILEVDLESGHISTLAVLPPRRTVIPESAARPEAEGGLGVPACVAGEKYAFEPVPTDVEVGPDGWLYVTSLPGGPESPELGARGAIFKVNRWTGETKLWVDDILTPTGLAIADNGDIYVASLFGGNILKFSCWGDHRSEFVTVNQPAAVEFQDGHLYATVDALSGAPAGPGAPPPAGPFAGKVVRIHVD